MKRYIWIFTALAVLLALTACEALNTAGPSVTVTATETPAPVAENTPEPTLEPEVDTGIIQPLDQPLETEPPAPTPLPNVITGPTTNAEVFISGDQTAIELKRQESSLGYVIYVWEDRFAYKTDGSAETFTLDWKGLMLPEVAVKVELVKDKGVDDVADAVVKELSKSAQADIIGAVSRPSYMMDGVLVRSVAYGDYEVYTDVYVIDNGEGGVFRVTATYFPEAIEDVGQALIPMLNSFQVQEMIK